MPPWLVGWAVRCALTLPTCAMKSMGESLYQSMDAPMAPLEKKVEAWRPAEKCCGALDLCATSSLILLPPRSPRRSLAATAPRPRWGPLARRAAPRLTPRPGVCRPAQQNRHDAHHGGERATSVQPRWLPAALDG